ncbi:MAG: SUMF1/EgtB/PvdO family nonheme iron enzyme [Planctomyces sp.]
MNKMSQEVTRSSPVESGRTEGLQVDRFTLLRRLGAGGYGEAWQAVDPDRRDQHRDGHVVLKFLHQHLLTVGDREQIESDFRLSYRRVQKLIHESICPLTELGEHPRFGPFQIMPYLSGVTLREYLRTQDPHRTGVDLPLAVRWLSPIAKALDYAHRHAIVHRDVKPCNIILSPATGELWLLDFGLAADIRYAVSLHSDVPTTARGTPLYMAPEQWQARPSDQRGQTDQYAVAIIAWQMLTGAVPYSADSELLRMAVLQDPVPELPEHLSQLQPIFEKALAKRWKDRYPTVGDFVSALTAAGGLELPSGQSEILSADGPADERSHTASGSLATAAASATAQPAAATEPANRDTDAEADEAVSGFQSIGRAHAAARQLHARGLHQQALDVLNGLPEHLQPHLDRQLHQQCTVARDQLAPLIQQAAEAERSVALCRLKRCLEQLRLLQPEQDIWKRKLTNILNLPRSATPPLLLAPFDQQHATAAQQMWGWHIDQTEIQSNSLGMQLTLIPPGTFLMGSPEGIGEERERPQHQVTITKPFWMSTFAVTQAQWRKLMQTEPWAGKSNVLDHDDAPATCVSWKDAVEFCRRLSTSENRKYTLPTEAQWEYACRAGTTTLWSCGDDEKQLPEYAWFDRNAGNANEKYAHRVGLKRPNPFGLCDMHGNTWEWCADAFDEKFYRRSPAVDPVNPPAGGSVVCRSGSWDSDATGARSAYRDRGGDPDDADDNIGFRIVAE